MRSCIGGIRVIPVLTLDLKNVEPPGVPFLSGLFLEDFLGGRRNIDKVDFILAGHWPSKQGERDTKRLLLV